MPLCFFRVSRAPVTHVCFSPMDLPNQDISLLGSGLDLFDGCHSPPPGAVTVFEQGLGMSKVKERTTSLRCASLLLGPELPTTDSCEAVTDLKGAESLTKPAAAFKVPSPTPFSGLRAHRPQVVNTTLPPCFSSAANRTHKQLH